MKKNYQGSPLSFILSCHSIADSVSIYLDEFTKSNVNITETSLATLCEKILNVEKVLGADIKLDKKESTQSIQISAELVIEKMKRLSGDMEYAFRTNLTRFQIITNSLGLDKIKIRLPREVLYGISLKFEENIMEFKNEMIQLGISSELLDDTLTAAINFKNNFKTLDSNITRITAISDDQQAELNAINDEITAICKLGKSIFAKDKTISKLFSYSVVNKKYRQNRGTKSKENAQTVTPLPDSVAA
jgi:hypothetical protein